MANPQNLEFIVQGDFDLDGSCNFVFHSQFLSRIDMRTAIRIATFSKTDYLFWGKSIFIPEVLHVRHTSCFRGMDSTCSSSGSCPDSWGIWRPCYGHRQE